MPTTEIPKTEHDLFMEASIREVIALAERLGVEPMVGQPDRTFCQLTASADAPTYELLDIVHAMEARLDAND